MVGTIKLSKEDTLNFVNSLFKPTKKEIENHNRFLEHINNNVIISRNEQGFDAEIADLDLTFLDEDFTDNQIKVEVLMRVRMPKNVYSCEQKKITYATISLESENKKYNEAANNNNLYWAA